jgi:alkanesulfonate monooxygenase
VAAGLIQPVLAREFADEAHGETAIPGLLAGDHDTVAAALAGLAAQGVEHLVLAASPGLEEAYRIGQHVLPRLRARVSPFVPPPEGGPHVHRHLLAPAHPWLPSQHPPRFL